MSSGRWHLTWRRPMWQPSEEKAAAPSLAQDLANVGMPQSGPTIEPVVSASAVALPAEEIDRLTT